MERLTMKTENGYEFIDDILYGPYAEEVQERLGQLEDMAEKREQGCEHCYSCSSCAESGLCPFEYEIEAKECDHYEQRYTKDTYCPKCGRKLVE